ncbi:MAG TPA: hypothetical protein VMJ10_20850 [Kofleriaceae bacterium]|nr:hypothetical protein [Kofleriaceae bacterium]
MVRAVAVVLLAGCGHVDFAPLATGDGGGDGGTAACTTFGAWSTPQALTDLDTIDNDWEPELSADGQWLVFSSDRAGGGQHLYLAQRTGPTAFGAPTEIAALTSATQEVGPAWDGASANLYFVRTTTTNPILLASAFSNGSFAAPVQVASLASDSVVAPSISEDNLEMAFSTSSTASSELDDITRASPSDPWPTAETVLEPPATGWPSISADRLTMYYESDSGSNDEIYVMTRPAIGQPFGAPTPFELDDTTVDEGDPFISHDGLTYLFASARAGSLGASDLWMSTRSCLD